MRVLWSWLALGSLLLSVVGRIVLAAVAWMISESAGASRLPGTPYSSIQTGLPLLLMQAIEVGFTECLALRMAISYTLLVSRARPTEDWHCYTPCWLTRRQVTRILALRVKLLCGRFPQPILFVWFLWDSNIAQSHSQAYNFNAICILTSHSNIWNKDNLIVEGQSHDGRRPFLPGVDDLSHELRPESNPLSSLPKKPSGKVHAATSSTPVPEVIENRVDFWPLPGTPLVKDQVQVLRINPSWIMHHKPMNTPSLHVAWTVNERENNLPLPELYCLLFSSIEKSTTLTQTLLQLTNSTQLPAATNCLKLLRIWNHSHL
jgi:hypothetical protein